jgi:HKD family nuclease
VAFVTTSGVATIINKLKELENREIKGEILVSQYLNFTQPEALKKLAQFKNIRFKNCNNRKCTCKRLHL